MTRSQAGSPTPEVPKSMTAASAPSRTSKLPGAMSPWNHAGRPVQVAASPAAHIARARSVSILPASALRLSRVSAS